MSSLKDQVSVAAAGSDFERWRACATFDALAQDVLEEILRQVEALSAGHTHYQDTRGLRAAMYMRPDDSYRAVSVRQRVLIPEPELLSSATLWRWICSGGEPLLLDTTLSVLTSFHVDGEHVELEDPREEEGKPLTGNSSLMLLLERDATHILLLPVKDLKGLVCGMVSVEVNCEAAIGTPGIWGDGGEEGCVALLNRAAAFLLDRLDDREVPGPIEDTSFEDEWLPVVGEHMRPRIRILQAFSAQDETLLLTGETGVGKSRLARWCHVRSARARGPLEVLDLSAVPEEMQIAHLMGWRKGAFTGAVADVDGAVARAQGGTLFIDEIDKLSLETQASMLNLLESYTYQPLGGQRGAIRADVRFIIGTNADLRALTASGAFRSDLYFRVCVLPVHVLALRERQDELMRWVHHMFERALGHAVEIEDQARVEFERALWPGNLRQLDNVIRRVVALMGLRQTPREVNVQDVRIALGMAQIQPLCGKDEDEGDLIRSMRESATHYVALTRGRVERGEPPLDVELLEGLRGMAYDEALRCAEGVEDAMGWLGKSELIKNRNHQRTIARERLKTQALLDEAKKSH